MSVPHSGTRTLVEYLALSGRDQGLPGRWWHFGNNEGRLRRFRIHAEIPLRNPLDVARSWAQRGKTGRPQDALLRAYQEMFAWLADNAGHFTLHRMEDLPRLAGTGDHPGAPADSPAIRRFVAMIREEVVIPHRDFFLSFYDAAQLRMED